jgi:Flp pilus assembly protein TadG
VNRAQRPGPRAHAGQTIVFVALASVVLFGAMGLVIDAGFDYAMRRAMQNAADAAALAGAHQIRLGETSDQVLQRVRDVAARNGVQDPSMIECRYITNSYPAGPTPSCSSSAVALDTLVPAGQHVTGVQVRVAERHGTFAMRALGVMESGTAAVATAQVQVAIVNPGPFMVCAIDTAKHSNPSGLAGGIYDYKTYFPDNGPPKYERTDGNDNCRGKPCGETKEGAVGPLYNPGAFAYWDGSLTPAVWNASTGEYEKSSGTTVTGPTWLIHDPSKISVCNNNSSSFNGINLNTAGLRLEEEHGYMWSDPGDTDWPITTGNVTSVQATVTGVNGCKAGQPPHNCIMILPIADNSGPGGTGSNVKMGVRTFGAFYVQDVSNSLNGNSHSGRLILHYDLLGPGSPSWVPGTPVPTTTKLID